MAGNTAYFLGCQQWASLPISVESCKSRPDCHEERSVKSHGSIGRATVASIHVLYVWGLHLIYPMAALVQLASYCSLGEHRIPCFMLLLAWLEEEHYMLGPERLRTFCIQTALSKTGNEAAQMEPESWSSALTSCVVMGWVLTAHRLTLASRLAGTCRMNKASARGRFNSACQCWGVVEVVGRCAHLFSLREWFLPSGLLPLGPGAGPTWSTSLCPGDQLSGAPEIQLPVGRGQGDSSL